ncbi:PREDICTED: ubiquitin-like-specific, partial [Prunus dulcis]
FDFSEQWFLFFPYLIKYKEKETRVVLSVKMVSQQQTKDSSSKKLGMVAPQDKSSKEMKSSKKMKFASSSAETEPTSQTTISDDSKTCRGMSTMPRVVKRKLQKLRPIVEVPLVDKKWSQIPKDVKEQIWEAVDMAFVKWKDFKSTLTRHYILPYTNDREKLSQPPETYKFIEKAQWDAFVASRLSKYFESVHSQHAQIREKLEYNHRLSRKGYAGLEDELEKTMPGDDLQKQVSEGKVRVDGSKDVLTMALGPEHPGRLRGVGAGISPKQYFNLPKPQRVSFDDRLKERLRVLLQEETKKMEAKAKEEALRMEARTKQLVEAEREHFLSQLSQLIPNFDPNILKQRISQSPKNPMSDKASCSGGDVIEVGDYSNMEAPSSFKSLCRYVETTLLPEDKILEFTIDKEVFGSVRDTFLLPEDITQFAGMEEIGATVVAVYMRHLHDVLKQAKICSMVGFIDPATVSANSGTVAERSRLVAARLQKTDGEQIFMMPYNPGRHWILLIVRAKRETVYFLDPLPGHRVVDEEAKNIVNSAIKIYNSHIGRAGRKAVIWKTLSGTPKQPSSVECGYYVMRFMRDIIMDPSLGFENM